MDIHYDTDTGYLVTKSNSIAKKGTPHIHQVELVIDPVTKASCISCSANSKLMRQIRENNEVCITYHNQTLDRYIRTYGLATIPKTIKSEFERIAYRLLTKGFNQEATLVYIDTFGTEILGNSKLQKDFNLRTYFEL